MKIILTISLLLNIILAGVIIDCENERCENLEYQSRCSNDDDYFDLDMLGY